MTIHNHNRSLPPALWNGCRIGATILMVMLIAGSCGRLKITGKSPGNQGPELILVNVPPGGELLGANPTVFWYGSDADGRVIRYDYAVVREDSAADGFSVKEYLARHNNACPGTNDLERFLRCAKDSLPWVSIFVDSSTASLPTQSRVPLYASFDTLDCDSQTVTVNIYDSTGNVIGIKDVRQPINCVSLSVGQYMFIRAVDDQGAESDIKYRSFLRDNHWPETRISAFDPYRTYFSLPALTETYRGITISWAGSDNLDFLPGRAKLDYHWRVYGPYPIGSGAPADRPKLADTAMYSAPILESNSGDPRKGVWVADTATIIYNLWRQADSLTPPPDTTRTAYFLFVIQSRDDASVADPTPAASAFQAVYAKFERKLLLVDETAYKMSLGGYPSWINNGYDSNRVFLRRMVDTIDAYIQGPHARFDPVLDFWQRAGQANQCYAPKEQCTNSVPLTVLSKHEMVLYIDDDIQEPITTNPDARPSLAQYLDVGGKLWLVTRVGILNGTNIGPSSGPVLYRFLDQKELFAPRYLGVSGMYYAGFFGVAKGINGNPPASNDEFIRSAAIESNDPSLQTPANLPRNMSIDSLRVDRHWLSLRATLKTDVIRGVPAVGYVERWTEVGAPGTRPLYVFKSWRPGNSSASDRLVAIRTIGPSMKTPKYKTAFMGCPLWFFKEAEAAEYVKGMTDWFYNHTLDEGP